MQFWSATTQLMGGLGLFLLGMWLMTEGLKLAGGAALQSILSSWTVTRIRAFISGFTLTALVQSSSAVTVSVIGFINAGLLDLSRSLWIIFGSNVGTTMTAWIVALIGFKFKVEALALPAIGIGAILHLFAHNVRAKSLGGAIAGLGLLFLGLQQLQGAFSDLGDAVDVSSWFTDDFLGMLTMVFIGLFMTTVMQSSSASMAIVLTAVSTDVIPLTAGAAAVIGANIGTTITALIAVLKATSNARRVAVAHVVFNLITALVAFLLIGVFINLVQWIQVGFNMQPNAAVSLALFHTVFNLLGVALMVPLEPRLTRWLATLFLKGETKTMKPQYLDRNIISVPDLATNSIALEQRRALGMLATLIAAENTDTQAQDTLELRELVSAINGFVLECSLNPLPQQTADLIQQMIKVNLRMMACLDDISSIYRLRDSRSSLSNENREKLDQLLGTFQTLVESIDMAAEPGIAKKLAVPAYKNVEKLLRELLGLVIDEARSGHVSAQEMEKMLRQLTNMRRFVRQYVKSAKEIAGFTQAQPLEKVTAA